MKTTSELKTVFFQNILVPTIIGISTSLFLSYTFYEGYRANKKTTQSDQIIQQSYLLQKLLSDAQAGLRGYLLSKKEIFLVPFNESKKIIDPVLNELENFVQNDPEDKIKAKEVKIHTLNWFQFANDILKTSINSFEDASKTMSLGEGEKTAVEIRNLLHSLIEKKYKLREDEEKKLNLFFQFSLILLIPFLVFAHSFVAYRGKNSIFKIAYSYNQKLEENKLQLLKLERENWLQDFKSQLSSVLVKAETVKGVSLELLKFLLEYTPGIAGSVLVSKNSEEKKYSRQITIGINLTVDQVIDLSIDKTLHEKVILLKKPFLFDDFVQNEWALQSETGKHVPKYLFIIPILFSNKCVALVELVLNEKPDEKFFDFLKNSSELLGAIFCNEIAKDKLGNINKELKIKSEELNEQRKKLQSSNEELAKREHLLIQSQKNLEENNAELEEANELLQNQASSLEEQKENLNKRNQELLIARNQLEKQSQNLEQANQHKSQFLARMSHELRTPLNSLMILAQLLIENRDKNLTHKQVESVTQILRSAQDLLHLINDILDLSKIESGNIELDISQFSIKKLFNWISSMFDPLVQKKNLELELICSNKEMNIETDQLRLQQIIGNLISNAIKFTDKGKISLKIVETENNSLNCPALQFIVTDTGSGISEDRLRSHF